MQDKGENTKRILEAHRLKRQPKRVPPMSPDAVVKQLLRWLSPSEYAVHARAATHLEEGRERDREIIGLALLRRLEHPEAAVRAAATRSLGRLQYVPARERLTQLMHHDPLWRIRDIAIEARAYVADETDATILADLETCLADEVPAVRGTAVRFFGIFASPKDLPKLERCLAAESNRYVRWELWIATYRLGVRANLQQLLDVLETADGEEAMNILFMLDYLIAQCPPASLREDARVLRKAVARVVERFPIRGLQAEDMMAKLDRGEAGA